MQLSEAIMLGSTMVDPYDPNVWNRCALGMAAAATGAKRHHPYYVTPAGVLGVDAGDGTLDFLTELRERFPILTTRIGSPCCQCEMVGGHPRLADVIVHLHDYHLHGDSPVRWTLDQIVDFIRRVEKADAVLRGGQLNPCAAPNYFAPHLGEIDGTRLGDVPDTSEARPAPAEVPA